MNTSNLVKSLELKNVSIASVSGKEIINSVSLTIYEGEIHMLLGPNGNGKSTLLHAIMGDPEYVVTAGTIYFYNQKINSMPIFERARAGIFLSFQNPLAVEGVVNLDFLKSFIRINNPNKKKPSLLEFYSSIKKAATNIILPEDFYNRYLNVGFSGGERKQYELLQLKISNCKLALMDELDSGLDVDALKEVDKIINTLHTEQRISGIIVSHYKKLCDNLDIAKFHIMINGQIVESGGRYLLDKIQHEGYNWCYRKHKLQKKTSSPSILDSCAVAQAK